MRGKLLLLSTSLLLQLIPRLQRECISLYFNTDIGANCTDLAGRTQDWDCACEGNFRTVFPCCLEQTCTEDEWDNMHTRGRDYGGTCGREPGSGMEIDLGECESKDFYYNPSAPGYAGSTSSEVLSTLVLSMSTAAPDEPSQSTDGTTAVATDEGQATDPAEGQDNESASEGSGGGDSTALGLGVGLGVGIPLLVVGMSVVYFLFWRTKRKDKQPSEESGPMGGSSETRDSTFTPTLVPSEDMAKSRPISELPASPGLGSPYAPSELPSDWGRNSMMAYDRPMEDRRSELG